MFLPLYFLWICNYYFSNIGELHIANDTFDMEGLWSELVGVILLVDKDMERKIDM